MIHKITTSKAIKESEEEAQENMKKQTHKL